MLGIYEKRHFENGEKIWFGRYRNLTNVLHWHFECEIIRVLDGRAQIKIGDRCFHAVKDDCFFCASEELHYIISQTDSLVEIVIFHEDLIKDIATGYVLASPKLPDHVSIKESLERIKKELSQKETFYREALESHVRGMSIDIFRNCQVVKQEESVRSHKNLITKINNEFSFITFEDAVRYSGYSSAHFSKVFKKLSGMTFSDYLNAIKVEHAIMLLRSDDNIAMTSVCVKCGFSTVRNFNRVFKSITGYAPRSLPKEFILNTGLRVSETDIFDPTDKQSMLI